jgi:hypothetical protein
MFPVQSVGCESGFPEQAEPLGQGAQNFSPVGIYLPTPQSRINGLAAANVPQYSGLLGGRRILDPEQLRGDMVPPGHANPGGQGQQPVEFKK